AALAEGFRQAAALNAPGAPGPRDGLVPPPAPELSGWKKSGLSPTALDEYETCPFKFFASRVLGLGEREEGTERGELSAAARGSVYHAALERFYRSLPEAAWAGKGDPLEHLDVVLKEVFAENDWRALGLYPLLWEAARLEMSAHLRAFAAWDLERLRAARFRPRLYETKLRGEPEGGAPGGIPWRGVADRVDADEAGRSFRVVDYKTRRSGRWKRPLARQAAEGESHQVPFYAELTGQALGEGWSFAGGDLLFLEAEDDERASELTPEDWAKARGPFLTGLAARVEAIAAGRFPIRPEDGPQGHCSWCDFPTLCRKSHGPSRARAARA
ncbi:MAG: PD-(D/E)XK nuclease family protein, partial [Elusimicrobia bacterium]|nr:PD-(D/E)XK nuclease family protein [Elusimicrobiota bacterium]